MMSRENGKKLLVIDHIRQSLADLISTPIGSRVMRRNYGTLVANLIDQPTSEALILKCYSTIYSATLLWEPRIQINQMNIGQINQGKTELTIEATLVETGENVNLNIPVSIGASI